MHKKMISAAANVYEVYKDGKYLNEVTLVDCCHMGRNMQSVYHTLKALGCTLKPKKELGDNGQGFIDECGVFYNREDAFKIASTSGQPFNPEFILPTNRLDSSCIRHFPEDTILKDWCDYNYISVEDSVSMILDKDSVDKEEDCSKFLWKIYTNDRNILEEVAERYNVKLEYLSGAVCTGYVCSGGYIRPFTKDSYVDISNQILKLEGDI